MTLQLHPSIRNGIDYVRILLYYAFLWLVAKFRPVGLRLANALRVVLTGWISIMNDSHVHISQAYVIHNGKFIDITCPLIEATYPGSTLFSPGDLWKKVAPLTNYESVCLYLVVLEQLPDVAHFHGHKIWLGAKDRAEDPYEMC